MNGTAILRKDDLALFPAHPSLAEELAAYYLRNREFLREFEPIRTADFFTKSRQLEILKKEAAEWEEQRAYRFYIKIEERPGEIIGSISLSNIVWGAFLSGFAGAKLDERYINRGYMTTALGLLVDFAFQTLGLHRIEANVMPRNKRSLRVLEKNGFLAEGLSKHYLQINGVWEDHIHMVKLNEAMHRTPAEWHTQEDFNERNDRKETMAEHAEPGNLHQ